MLGSARADAALPGWRGDVSGIPRPAEVAASGWRSIATGWQSADGAGHPGFVTLG